MKVLKVVVWSSIIIVEKEEELREKGFDLRKGIKRFTFVCEQEK
jgi:hypothetical protein